MNTVYCSLLKKSIFNLCDLSCKPTGSSSSGLYRALNKGHCSSLTHHSCVACVVRSGVLSWWSASVPTRAAALSWRLCSCSPSPSTNPEGERRETASCVPIPEVFLDQLCLLGIVSGYSEELIMVKISDPACRNSASHWRISSAGWDFPPPLLNRAFPQHLFQTLPRTQIIRKLFSVTHVRMCNLRAAICVLRTNQFTLKRIRFKLHYIAAHTIVLNQ